jgi:hypothetical protein
MGTELFYDPPIQALQFPLHVGLAWDNTAALTLATGTAQGYPCPYFGAPCSISSSSKVDAQGKLETPFQPAGFEVLRVVTQATASLGFYPTGTKATHNYVAECGNIVGTVISQSPPTFIGTTDNFSDCHEVWRLTP